MRVCACEHGSPVCAGDLRSIVNLLEQPSAYALVPSYMATQRIYTWLLVGYAFLLLLCISTNATPRARRRLKTRKHCHGFLYILREYASSHSSRCAISSTTLFCTCGPHPHTPTPTHTHHHAREYESATNCSHWYNTTSWLRCGRRAIQKIYESEQREREQKKGKEDKECGIEGNSVKERDRKKESLNNKERARDKGRGRRWGEVRERERKRDIESKLARHRRFVMIVVMNAVCSMPSCHTYMHTHRTYTTQTPCIHNKHTRCTHIHSKWQGL